MNQIPLFNIFFNDGSNYQGGTLEQPKWLDIPDKPIRSIFYSLPLGDFLTLIGYEKYYHFVEVCKDLNGDRSGQVQLEFAYLIGKKGNDYRIYKISLRTGQIQIIDTDKDNEMIKQLNPIGWKKGI